MSRGNIFGFVLGLAIGAVVTGLLQQEQETVPRGRVLVLPAAMDKAEVSPLAADPAGVQPTPTQPQGPDFSLLEAIQIQGTPAETLVWDLLREYPNESQLHVKNRTMNSPDPQTQAVAVCLHLQSVADPEELALNLITDGVFAPSDIGVASYLAFDPDSVSDAAVDRLSRFFDEQEFPGSIAPALALSALGDEIYMQMWQSEALEELRLGCVSDREQLRLFEMCRASFSHSGVIEDVVSELAREKGAIGELAQSFLEEFQVEPEDPHEFLDHVWTSIRRDEELARKAMKKRMRGL